MKQITDNFTDEQKNIIAKTLWNVNTIGFDLEEIQFDENNNVSYILIDKTLRKKIIKFDRNGEEL
jgi:hypothetical protein